VIERAEAIERICARFGVPLPAAALQFPFRESAVGCVIAGLASPAEVNDACERLATPIPDALWLALDQEGLVRPTAEHAR
jgi:D-threo-aldose 1-dehydrogenase